MTVYTLNPLQDARWAEFVQHRSRASVFHTTDWLEALRRTYGYEPVVYTTSPPGATLTNGIVFCRISSWLTGCRMVSLPFADHCEPLVESPREFREIFSFLQCALEREKLRYIEIRPLSADLPVEPDMQNGNSFCLHLLDLRPPLQNLFRGFQKDSIQRKIRRAERESLRYEEGCSEALLNEFHRLLLLTRRRHKLPPQPLDWFRNLVACLGNRLKVHVAFKDGRAIASILTLLYGQTAVYKYGCSDARFHNLGAMPFLFWQAIQGAKAQGFQELDLGRTDSENRGLITFKERLGATRSKLVYVRCSAPHRWSATEGLTMKIAKQVLGRMPDGLLTAAGRLLYRHVG